MRIKTIAAAGAIALLFAGCGKEKTATVANSDDTSATTAKATGGSESAWCTIAKGLDAEFDKFDKLSSDPAEAKAFFAQLDASFKKAVPKAPAEIKADMKTSQEGFAELKTAFEKAKYNILDVDTAIFERLDAKMTTADDNISKYNEKECGMPNTNTGDSETSTDPAPAGGSVRDQLIESFTAAGFTKEQAMCVSEKMTPDLLELDDTDAKVVELLANCGVSKP